MSEHITHIAAYEDIVRLFIDSPEICEAFKTCIQIQYDSGLMGSGTRGNHIFALPILETYKDQWEAVKDDREPQIKLAYAIGWLTHRAADRRLKLVFAEAEDDPNPAFSNNMCRIYQDAMSFRKVYDGGIRPCLSPKEVLSPATFDFNMQSHPAAGLVNILKTEPLFNRMWQADMISKHLFMESQNNFDSWVSTFVERFSQLTEDFREYEKAYNDPDPIQSQRYYVEDNFYDNNDDIIKYVRTIQNSEIPQDELSGVIEKAKEQSLYAQTLRQGYLFIKGASDYFVGTISKIEFQEIIDKRIS